MTINTTELTLEAQSLLCSEAETMMGLQFLGITIPDGAPSITVTVPWSLDNPNIGCYPHNIPATLNVDPTLLTEERMALIERLEDDLDNGTLDSNDYYNFMIGLDPTNLSGDDSFFDYGNSMVLAVGYEIFEILKLRS